MGAPTTARTDFYEQVATYEDPVARHELFLAAYRRERARAAGRPLDVLDVGAGTMAVLGRGIEEPDRYHATDVKSRLEVDLERYRQVDLERERLADAFEGARFDVVFCGEVIEHVFSPDDLLRQLRSVLAPAGLLVLSTPNLAYWVNRILLVFGISPLFVENSSEVVLGRRWRRIGQGNPTQGHVRLFTHRSMLDLLAREGWTVQSAQPVSVWNLPGDKLLGRISTHLGPDIVYELRDGRA